LLFYISVLPLFSSRSMPSSTLRQNQQCGDYILLFSVLGQAPRGLLIHLVKTPWWLWVLYDVHIYFKKLIYQFS